MRWGHDRGSGVRIGFFSLLGVKYWVPLGLLKMFVGGIIPSWIDEIRGKLIKT